ncbi:MAG TPA: hypothetical protein VEW26_14290 [Allosphingosinicella sp.]|nr:hypothetical protein [Allosphingosinicella sp.]
MRRLILLLCLGVAACGEPATVADRAAQDNEAPADEAVVKPGSRPVRIGELGANFQACGAAGTTRNLKPGEALPVSSAPFDNAGETGRVASRARFFICTRSLDQKWFGIVFDEDGALAERCGVSEPVTRRRDYDGPCGSGWVQSAFVKVIAGEAAVPATPTEAANVSEAVNSASPAI